MHNASKLGSKYLCGNIFHEWLCFYAGEWGGKWQLPAPLFLKKAINKVQNQYKQIFLLFAPGVVQTFFLCSLSAGCCLFKHGSSALHHSLGSPSAESADF